MVDRGLQWIAPPHHDSHTQQTPYPIRGKKCDFRNRDDHWHVSESVKLHLYVPKLCYGTTGVSNRLSPENETVN